MAWLVLICCFGCGDRGNQPYLFMTGSNFDTVPQPDYNRATTHGVALGKKLFFDPLLSQNGQVSCATCHHTERSFSDGVALSTSGVSGKKLIRHAPALFNLAWMPGYFWEGGAKNLESQVFGPLEHPDEMAADLPDLIRKLNMHPEYPRLFKAAFGKDTITTQYLARALAQYERTLISDHSRYDLWIRGEGGTLTPQELRGYQIYRTNCAACHTEGLFTDNAYHNNGLDSAFTDPAEEFIFYGRYRISLDSADIGKFKTPSLRNLSYTAPYMHDGRLATLEDVLAHYDHGVYYFPTLDPALQKQKNPGIPLTSEEMNDLRAFLRTLDDPITAKE